MPCILACIRSLVKNTVQMIKVFLSFKWNEFSMHLTSKRTNGGKLPVCCYSFFAPPLKVPFTSSTTSPFHQLFYCLMSVWPCIDDDMKRVKPTRCYTMVYWTLWIAQHVSGITMQIVRSLRLYRWSRRMAPHLGYGRLLVWCMAVGFGWQPVVKHPSNRA